jgi:hypothetical protein
MDVISSVTLLSPPKYLTLYRLLLTRDSSFWPSQHDDGFDLRLESLTGCPDEALLAIAEASALAHWKLQESRSGCLSVRELVRRGDNIEQQLRRNSDTQPGYSDVTQLPLRPPKLLPLSLGQMAIRPSITSVDSLVVSSPPVPFLDESLRQSVAEIFRESALLYLYTVLSGPYPGTHLP